MRVHEEHGRCRAARNRERRLDAVEREHGVVELDLPRRSRERPGELRAERHAAAAAGLCCNQRQELRASSAERDRLPAPDGMRARVARDADHAHLDVLGRVLHERIDEHLDAADLRLQSGVVLVNHHDANRVTPTLFLHSARE